MSPATRSTSGYSAWRLIAEELRSQIADGTYPFGSKLPTESEIADRFGVHRNTARQAIASLVADDLVEKRHGSGTFVMDQTLLVHRIGLRTRLSDSGRQGDSTSIRLLSAALESAPPADVATHLDLGGRAALRIETTSAVNENTISRATSWFDADLTPGLDEHLARTRSITSALRAVGIDDYLRAWTTIGARTATAAESTDIGVPQGTTVLVLRSLNTLIDGTPLQYANTRFRADRVELDVTNDGLTRHD